MLPTLRAVTAKRRIASSSSSSRPSNHRSAHTLRSPDPSSSACNDEGYTNTSENASDLDSARNGININGASSSPSTELPPWPTPYHPNTIPTPYQLLSAQPGQPYDKSAFYKLVKHYHPDRTSGALFSAPNSQARSRQQQRQRPHDKNNKNSHGIDTKVRLERYRLLVAAHTLLSDPVARSTYDTYGVGWVGSDSKKSQTSSYSHSMRGGWPEGCDPMRNATWEDWEIWRERMNMSMNMGDDRASGSDKAGGDGVGGGGGFGFGQNFGRQSGGYRTEHDSEHIYIYGHGYGRDGNGNNSRDYNRSSNGSSAGTAGNSGGAYAEAGGGGAGTRIPSGSFSQYSSSSSSSSSASRNQFPSNTAIITLIIISALASTATTKALAGTTYGNDGSRARHGSYAANMERNMNMNMSVGSSLVATPSSTGTSLDAGFDTKFKADPDTRSPDSSSSSSSTSTSPYSSPLSSPSSSSSPSQPRPSILSHSAQLQELHKRSSNDLKHARRQSKSVGRDERVRRFIIDREVNRYYGGSDGSNGNGNSNDSTSTSNSSNSDGNDGAGSRTSDRAVRAGGAASTLQNDDPNTTTTTTTNTANNPHSSTSARNDLHTSNTLNTLNMPNPQKTQFTDPISKPTSSTAHASVPDKNYNNKNNQNYNNYYYDDKYDEETRRAAETVRRLIVGAERCSGSNGDSRGDGASEYDNDNDNDKGRGESRSRSGVRRAWRGRRGRKEE